MILSIHLDCDKVMLDNNFNKLQDTQIAIITDDEVYKFVAPKKEEENSAQDDEDEDEDAETPEEAKTRELKSTLH